MDICQLKFCLSATKFKILRYECTCTIAYLKLKLWYKKSLLYTGIYFPVYPVDLSFYGTTSAETIEGKRFDVIVPIFPVHFNILI